MNSTVRSGVLVSLEILIGFAVVGVLPFAWLLRDGLGPDSVSTTGLAAVSKAFMSFYIGPVILLLVLLDLAIRGLFPAAQSPSSNLNSKWTVWAIAIAVFSLLSYAMVWLMIS